MATIESTLGSSTGPRVLIIDDNPDIFSYLTTYFHHLQPELHMKQITDSTESVRHILEFSPSVVLLDIDMPGKSGLDVLEDMNTIPLERSPSVIVFTVYDLLEYQVKANRYGIDDYFIKDQSSLDSLHNRILLAIENRAAKLYDRDVLQERPSPRVLRRLKDEIVDQTSYFGGYDPNINFEILDSFKAIRNEGDRYTLSSERTTAEFTLSQLEEEIFSRTPQWIAEKNQIANLVATFDRPDVSNTELIAIFPTFNFSSESTSSSALSDEAWIVFFIRGHVTDGTQSKITEFLKILIENHVDLM